MARESLANQAEVVWRLVSNDWRFISSMGVAPLDTSKIQSSLVDKISHLENVLSKSVNI